MTLEVASLMTMLLRLVTCVAMLNRPLCIWSAANAGGSSGMSVTSDAVLQVMSAVWRAGADLFG